MSNVNYRIVPIGSSNQGWAIERDGKITRTGGSLEVLGAWLDAILAGASEYDADDIAAVIASASRSQNSSRRLGRRWERRRPMSDRSMRSATLRRAVARAVGFRVIFQFSTDPRGAPARLCPGLC